MTAQSVSVALCTYNGERYLETQLRSIIGQSLPPAEVVVADDGSTDATLAIIDRVARESTVPVRVLEPGARLGVTANFQRAAEACASPLIALADQDDVWRPERIAAAFAVFQAEPDVLLVHSDARLVDADGTDLGHRLLGALRPTPEELRLLASDRPLEAYLRRNFVTGTTVTFRASLRDLAVPFPPAWVHDEWLAVVAAVHGRVRYLDQPLVDYRQHGGNEIGMESPSTARRIGRMLERRGDRLELLAERSAVLAARVEPSAAVDAADRIRRKAAFEARRRAYPRGRLLRLGPVLGQALRGRYREFSSQGRLDIVRDLVQPA